MTHKDLIIDQMNLQREWSEDNVKPNTHEGRLVMYLFKYKSITSLQAIQDLGNTRLSGTIHSLKRKGYNFTTETVAVPNRFGGKTRVAEYRFKEYPTWDKV